MFNRSLTSGLRPTIANLPSASAAVSTQSRGKGTLVDPFASVEAKGSYYLQLVNLTHLAVRSFTLHPHFRLEVMTILYFFMHSLTHYFHLQRIFFSFQMANAFLHS